MKSLPIFKHLLFSSLLILLRGNVYADVSIFKTTFPDMAGYTHKAQQHKIEKLPSTILNSSNNLVPIETYIASIPHPFDGTGFYEDYSACNIDDFNHVKCQFNYKLSTANAKNFKIFILPGLGATLAPKDWTIIRTDMGPSGVASATLASPNQDEAMTIFNTSSCVFCAMFNASIYFPEVKKKSLANEFGAIEDKTHSLNIVKVNQNKVYFSYQIPNYPNKTHGIAFYADESDGSGYTNFQEIKATLKPEHQSWTREILNFYQATH